MSIIVLGYTCDDKTPILQGYGEACDEQGNICSTTVIPLEQIVTASYKYIPLTGVFSIEEIYNYDKSDLDGWKWDKRLLEYDRRINTIYTHKIGGHESGLLEGTKFSWWQSGSLFNTGWAGISSLKFDGEVTSWTPLVESGVYTVLWKVKNLYSDFSCIEKVNCTSMENGHHIHDVREDANLDTLTCVVYRRDESFINWPEVKYLFKDYFTGKLPENSDRLPTVDEDADIIWENLDPRRNEFIIENLSLITKDSVFTLPDDFNVKKEVFKFLKEFLGLESTSHLHDDLTFEELGIEEENKELFVSKLLEHFSINFFFVFSNYWIPETERIGDWIAYIEGQTPEAEIKVGTPEVTPRTWRLHFNKEVCFSVGEWPVERPVTPQIVHCVFEDKGYGNVEGRDVFTKWFPLVNNSVRVFIVDDLDGDGTNDYLEEWEEVENLNFSKSTDKHYSVDYDLGIISLGGYKAPNLILKEALADEDDEIVVFPEQQYMASYPPQGIIKIDDEEILYYSKGKDRFYDLVRGHNSTTATSHLIGSFVEDTKHGEGVPAHRKIFIAYDVTPRVEYEIQDKKLDRTANRNPFIDLKAITNVVTNNVLQISPVETHVAKLVLETTEDWITANVFGPVYYGTDFARLIARAEDSIGNPVEGIKITIEIADKSFGKSATGTLNGIGKEFTSISNSLGEIYAMYNAPYDWDEVKRLVSSTSHNGDHTKMRIAELPPNVSPDSVTVFQVLKHDHVMGTVGDKVDILIMDDTTDPGTLVGLKNTDFNGDGTTDAFVVYDNTTHYNGTTYNRANITVDADWEDIVSFLESEQEYERETPYHGSDVFPIGTHTVPGCSNSAYGNAVAKIKFVNRDGGYSWILSRIDNAAPYYHKAHVIPLDVDGGGVVEDWEINAWGTQADDEGQEFDSEGRRPVGAGHSGANRADYDGATALGNDSLNSNLHIDVDGNPIPGSPPDVYSNEQRGVTIVLSGTFPAEFEPGNPDGWYPEQVYIIARNSEVWNSDFLDGVNVLLYEWSNNYAHPVTGDTGAYGPVRPDIASGRDLIFHNKLLPLPNATDIGNNLGGYVIVAPDIVTLQAHCRDPVSGRIILSNKLRLRLDLPMYLRGVAGDRDKYGNFSSSPLPVPYGFGFAIEGGEDTGTGLGGANFLTVNPFDNTGSIMNILNVANWGQPEDPDA